MRTNCCRRNTASCSRRPSRQGDDPARRQFGNWMNSTRVWFVGRNLPAMHAAEIHSAVAEAVRRPDVDATRIAARASGVSEAALLPAAVVNEQIAPVPLAGTPHSVRAAVDAPMHTNLHDAVIPGFALKWDPPDVRDPIRPRSAVWTDPTDWMANVVPLRRLHLLAERPERDHLSHAAMRQPDWTRRRIGAISRPPLTQFSTRGWDRLATHGAPGCSRRPWPRHRAPRSWPQRSGDRWPTY